MILLDNITYTTYNINNNNRNMCRPNDPAYVVQLTTCPQQPNGYDCGVYVILFAKYLASALKHLPGEGQLFEDPECINWDKICEDMGPRGSCWVIPERAQQHRREVYEELLKQLNERPSELPQSKVMMESL